MGNPVVYFEIGCRDSSKTAAFFAQMFGWDGLPEGPAVSIRTGSEAGIQGMINSLGHEPYNYVTFYVQVEDLQVALDKAESLGGKACVPPMEVPGSGHFAWMSDPEGNTIGLWKPLQP
ncbi:VOC family protein [Gloeobacter morelensis]|uniref:VOC family protein n=1 Tax=Gloeobacter morelensis MG652769 TaxID=2781736 RepID=A0ABY3PG13_9CYAN|nr:VOC family protein [Gloeobacter morelensis]UFP92574.1 VOC family protein [Gloeobacter morelensis MG652769]